MCMVHEGACVIAISDLCVCSVSVSAISYRIVSYCSR
jgi:hypothetical protein